MSIKTSSNQYIQYIKGKHFLCQIVEPLNNNSDVHIHSVLDL
jgi:hypothetical protein